MFKAVVFAPQVKALYFIKRQTVNIPGACCDTCRVSAAEDNSVTIRGKAYVCINGRSSVFCGEKKRGDGIFGCFFRQSPISYYLRYTGRNITEKRNCLKCFIRITDNNYI